MGGEIGAQPRQLGSNPIKSYFVHNVIITFPLFHKKVIWKSVKTRHDQNIWMSFNNIACILVFIILILLTCRYSSSLSSMTLEK